jgi:hypothetical protein
MNLLLEKRLKLFKYILLKEHPSQLPYLSGARKASRKLQMGRYFRMESVPNTMEWQLHSASGELLMNGDAVPDGDNEADSDLIDPINGMRYSLYLNEIDPMYELMRSHPSTCTCARCDTLGAKAVLLQFQETDLARMYIDPAEFGRTDGVLTHIEEMVTEYGVTLRFNTNYDRVLTVILRSNPSEAR